MIRPKKKSSLHHQPLNLNDKNNEVQSIQVQNTPPPTTKKVGDGADPNANFKQKYFVLVDNRLIQFNCEGDTMERGVLNIQYARLKRTHIKDENQKIWGFILMAKGQFFHFYHADQSVIDKWLQALKYIVIFVDLKEDFTIGNLLGRGNFAKVHLITRKNDPDGVKYALKTIEKSGIKECKRNIQSMVQEIDILRRVKHKGIIALHEVYESSKYMHLVLSYLDGGELFERIKLK